MKRYYSDFLFARPSFLEGWARLFDFSGSLNDYNRSDNPDTIAAWADWLAVGQDISDAMGKFAQENNLKGS